MGLVLTTPDVIVEARGRAAAAGALATVAANRGRAPMTAWHNLGDPGEPALTADFVPFQGSIVRFRKTPSGEVALTGSVAPVAVSFNPAIIFTLPEYFRPDAVAGTAFGQYSLTELRKINVFIFANGDVWAEHRGVIQIQFDTIGFLVA